ncbi:MAG: hypothetical protein AAB834_06590, partial [Patescibacteria group bacterium]
MVAINLKKAIAWLRLHASKPYGVYSLIALAILLPMLRPGYIFALDMAFAPVIRLPEEVTSSYLFYTVLHALNILIPSQVLQKGMLFSILLLAGLGMHALMRHFQIGQRTDSDYAAWSAYISGTLYMINPFTYSRFMAGQFAVLLGYACLPFFARALLGFIANPTTRSSLVLAVWAVIISIVSIHTLGLLAVLTGVTLAVSLYQYRRKRSHLTAIAKYGSITILAFLISSSYWLIPLAGGSSTTAQAINSFTAGDQQAFATLGSTIADKVGNVLQLQGFWAEARNLFVLPQEQLALWPLALLAVWTLVAAGAVLLWKRGHQKTVVIFAGSAVVAIVLAVTGAPAWLSEHTPFFAGYREPHKFVGLVALAYAILAGESAGALLQRYNRQGKEAALSIVTVALIVLPVIFTP